MEAPDNLVQPPRRGGGLLLNLLTLVLLLASLAAGVIFALLFVNPQSGLNPFPRPTVPPTLGFPTATHTSEFPTLPPTWTATPRPPPSNTPTVSRTPTQSGTPTATPTPGPSHTPSVTASPSHTATRTATLTPTGPTSTASATRSAFLFTLQPGSPTALPNFANTAGCNWMGIAGQAFDLSGRPVTGLVVHLEGGGKFLDALTGSAPAYGAGGYELFLQDHPVATNDLYRVQLLNQSGEPLSDVILVDTFADCSKNLILVNFVQNH